MRNNPIQFAVTREDPSLELSLIEDRNIDRALLIASGGCTPLSIYVHNPEISQTLVDPNPHQLEHIQIKVEALRKGVDRKRFNVGSRQAEGLNERGNFESLFRGLRQFLHDLVVPREELIAFFQKPQQQTETRTRLIEHEYWPVSFDMFFCDSLLRTMFGPEAIQNAPPGSYPRYFQSVLEEGLKREDVSTNYFLHHIFLGQYLDDAQKWPPYLSESVPEQSPDFDYFEGFVDERNDIGTYDFVNLSNIYDWMGGDQKKELSRHLVEHMKPGSTVLIRQLNNEKDLKQYFEPAFTFNDSLEEYWRTHEQSLFYSRYNIGRKT